jgi:hypothetical protein
MERAYRIRTYTTIDSPTGSLVTTLGPSCDRRDIENRGDAPRMRSSVAARYTVVAPSAALTALAVRRVASPPMSPRRRASQGVPAVPE